MRIWRYAAWLLSLCLALSLAGCGLFGGDEQADSSPSEAESEDEAEFDPEYPVRAGGIELAARPGRVISLAPALTEKLYDLGMDDRLVGVSDYCDYPRSVLTVSPCGTAQIPNLDVIETLSPHLILAEAELPEDVMERLEELGIPVAVLPHANSVDELYFTYTDLARLLEGESAGKLIGDSVMDEFGRRLQYLEGLLSTHVEENGRKVALYLCALDFTMATEGTFEDDLLEYIGLDNVARGYENWEYPPEEATSPEGREAFAAVDIIFLDESFVTIGDLEQHEFYKALPATVGDSYLYISLVEMERQSLRCLDQLARMAAYAYPDAQPLGGFDFGDGAIGAERGGGDESDREDDRENRADDDEGDAMLEALLDMP